MIKAAAQHCSISHASSPMLCRETITLKKQQQKKMKKMMKGLKHSQMRGVAGRLGRRW